MTAGFSDEYVALVTSYYHAWIDSAGWHYEDLMPSMRFDEVDTEMPQASVVEPVEDEVGH